MVAEGKLYSPALLSLATELAAYPMNQEFPIQSSGRSRTCGSTVDIGLAVAADGQISSIGMRVSACAVGQASAAIMARSAVGRHGDDLQAAYADIGQWLMEATDVPDWPAFDLLAPARDYQGRHEALLLPWKVACSALCKMRAAG